MVLLPVGGPMAKKCMFVLTPKVRGMVKKQPGGPMAPPLKSLLPSHLKLGLLHLFFKTRLINLMICRACPFLNLQV